MVDVVLAPVELRPKPRREPSESGHLNNRSRLRSLSRQPPTSRFRFDTPPRRRYAPLSLLAISALTLPTRSH